MKLWFLLWFASVGCFLVTPLARAASSDYRVHWRTLLTEHFEIIYDQKQRSLADTYGIAAEQAYEILKTRFSELPRKAYLVLMDRTDETNGLSTFLPYPAMTIYPVLPDSLSTLDYYGNWPLDLILHEYTHVLTFEPVHGFYVPLKYVFGTIIHPNGVLPRWYLEGLAVESESRFTDFGRLKSPRTDAELRALVEDHQLDSQTIAIINDQLVPNYPYGERPYLFGSVLWEHMAQKGGPELVDGLNQDYGRRLPFLVQQPVAERLGQHYQGLLRDTFSEIKNNVDQQFQLFSKPEDIEPFQDLDFEEFSPSISPDGHKLAFLTAGQRYGQVRLIERDGATPFPSLKSQKLFDAIGSHRLSWMPDSHSFVFDQIDDMDPYHTYRELYQYDLQTRQTKQLTFGLRAQEPGVAADGHRVVFIANSGASQWLGLIDLQAAEVQRKGSIHRLYKPPELERLSFPEFISAHEVVFTHRHKSGVENLELLDLKTGQIKTLYPNSKELRHPKQTPLGLLVATTDSGIQNMALADLRAGTLKPLTNTRTEIQSADWDPLTKKLIATRHTGRGRKLIATAPTTESLPKVGHVIKGPWPKAPEPKPVLASTFEEESYQPIEYLWPRYWMPFAYPVYNGVYVQGSTTMSDPAGINTYTASLAFDTVTSHGSFGLQYVNSSLPPDIELSYVQSEQYLGASGFVLTDQTAIADLNFYLPYLGPHYHLLTGGIWNQIDASWTTRFVRRGPLATFSYSNWNDPRVEGAGTTISLTHEQFLNGGTDTVAYGRTILGLMQGWRQGLPAGHRIVATGRSLFSPQLPFNDVIALGDGSLGANYLVSLSNSQFLFRGYPTGTFVGRKIVNWNLEYQFPIAKAGSGWGTAPIYSRGWDLALFTDGISVDGAGYDAKLEEYRLRTLSHFAISTGAEARWNTTIAYSYPVTWIFGLYYGMDQQIGNSLMPFIGLAFSDLTSIDRLQKNWFKRW